MPVRVRAFCGFGRWHDIEVEADVTAYVEYAGGATGTFITCTGEAPGTNRFEVSLTGGQLVYENGPADAGADRTRRSDRFIREYAGGFGKPNVTVADITPDEPYPMHKRAVIRAFADHILTGAPMIAVAAGREGLCSLMLANAMLLSSVGRTRRSSCPVTTRATPTVWPCAWPPKARKRPRSRSSWTSASRFDIDSHPSRSGAEPHER